MVRAMHTARRAPGILLLALSFGTLATLANVSACSSNDDGGARVVADAGSETDRDDGGAGDAGGGEGDDDDAATGADAGAADGGTEDAGSDAGADAATGPFTLTSSAFANDATIPAVHTCDGANTSPALAWTNPPAGAKSFAVVVRDLALSGRPNYHWVIFDIPVATRALDANVPKTATPAVPAGARQTSWSFGAQQGYGGPCPPSQDAAHEYQFSVYALDTASLGTTSLDAATVDQQIQARKIAGASLSGTYKRQ